MSGKQLAVLWLGLALIVVRGATSGQFAALWSNVSAPTSASTSSNAVTKTATYSTAENGNTGSVNV